MRAPILPTLTALPLLLAAPALAEVPRVAVDIAPVHALVAQVMAGVGTPDLVLPPGASPHGHSLRPSDARALQEADLVIWIGPELTPWLSGALDGLSGDAARLDLLAVEGVRRLGFREGASFEAHAHEDDETHEGAHAHADEHAHDEEHAHDDAPAHAEEHAEEHADEDEHGHDPGGIDPHAWLDPVNATVWLDVIAAELSRMDPANAQTYAANAAAARDDLAGLQAGIAGRMAALSGDFIVFHDAYHYFEARFGTEASGAISLSDASDPGPARVDEIRDLVAARGISCVFVEPQFNRGLVDAVFEGTDVAIGVIDPLGATLEPGAGLYRALIEGVAASFEDCLG